MCDQGLAFDIPFIWYRHADGVAGSMKDAGCWSSHPEWLAQTLVVAVARQAHIPQRTIA